MRVENQAKGESSLLHITSNSTLNLPQFFYSHYLKFPIFGYTSFRYIYIYATKQLMCFLNITLSKFKTKYQVDIKVLDD